MLIKFNSSHQALAVKPEHTLVADVSPERGNLIKLYFSGENLSQSVTTSGIKFWKVVETHFNNEQNNFVAFHIANKKQNSPLVRVRISCG